MLRLGHLPRKTSKKIVNKVNEGDPFVVVPGRGGRVSLWNLDSYRRQQKNAHTRRLWTLRGKKAPVLGPIGCQPLGIVGTLSRKEIYEGR